jgi:hypothetical protein
VIQGSREIVEWAKSNPAPAADVASSVT